MGENIFQLKTLHTTKTHFQDNTTHKGSEGLRDFFKLQKKKGKSLFTFHKYLYIYSTLVL